MTKCFFGNNLFAWDQINIILTKECWQGGMSAPEFLPANDR